MEKTIWRGIAVLLMSLPIAWVGHSLELKDQAILKEFVSVDQFRAFFAARMSGEPWVGYVGISVLCFVYLLISEAIATGLMTGFRKFVKQNNPTPNQAAQATVPKAAEPGC